jgi:hypothetical protein
LAGVSIEVTDFRSNGEVRFSGMTSATGTLQVTRLKPGAYRLRAEFLGIGAAYQCFHVAKRSSRQAESRMNYEWGDYSIATSRIAGRIVDSKPVTEGGPLWNASHRVNIPITNARITLEDPVTRQVYTTTSDWTGSFSFNQARVDTYYVLHVEDAGTGRKFDVMDLLIQLTPSANRDELKMMRTEMDDCGGIRLGLTNAPL